MCGTLSVAFMNHINGVYLPDMYTIDNKHNWFSWMAHGLAAEKARKRCDIIGRLIDWLGEIIECLSLLVKSLLVDRPNDVRHRRHSIMCVWFGFMALLCLTPIRSQFGVKFHWLNSPGFFWVGLEFRPSSAIDRHFAFIKTWLKRLFRSFLAVPSNKKIDFSSVRTQAARMEGWEELILYQKKCSQAMLEPHLSRWHIRFFASRNGVKIRASSSNTSTSTVSLLSLILFRLFSLFHSSSLPLFHSSTLSLFTLFHSTFHLDSVEPFHVTLPPLCTSFALGLSKTKWLDTQIMDISLLQGVMPMRKVGKYAYFRPFCCGMLDVFNEPRFQAKCLTLNECLPFVIDSARQYLQSECQLDLHYTRLRGKCVVFFLNEKMLAYQPAPSSIRFKTENFVFQGKIAFFSP